MQDVPNVVIIATHDSGRHFGCYGVDTVRTPEIDRLAGDGYRFSNVFTAAPQCSPGRAAMFTGQYPQTNGVLGLASEPWGWTLREPRDHLSYRLGDAGYRTVLFGFQHETVDDDGLGFDERRTEATRAADVASDFETFLSVNSGEPFYAQVAFHETHRPFDTGEGGADDETGVSVPPYIVENEASRAEFAELGGAVHEVDRAVGRIRRALETAGVADDTILVFTSDHGISFTRAKGYLYDPGIEIPLVMHWPGGGIEGGHTCDWLLSNIDVVPTLLELLDRPAPRTDGLSFAGAFRGGADPPRDAVHAMYHDHSEWGFGPHARCVRTDDHKLIRNFTPDRVFDPPVDLSGWDHLGRDGIKGGSRPPVELYDLGADPDEFENRAEDPDCDTIRADLDDRLWGWLERVDDPLLDGLPPSPYYDQAMSGSPDRPGAG